MEISKRELADRYSRMTDEDIINLYLQNTLTRNAREAIQQEIYLRALPAEQDKLKRRLDEIVSDNSSLEAASSQTDITSAKSNLYGTLSVGIAVLIIMAGIILSIVLGSLGYMLICATAFFVTPFGFLLGLLGIWKNKEDELAVKGILLNIVLFLIGTFLNPIVLVGGHNLH